MDKEITIMHIGKDIKEVFDNGPKIWTVTWFANQLNCDRRNIYNIFGRQSIDIELLMRISKILDYNFFANLVMECEKEITKNKEFRMRNNISSL